MAGSRREKIRNCIKRAWQECCQQQIKVNSISASSSCWNVAILTRVFPLLGNQESQFAVSHSKWRGGEREGGVGPRHQTAGNALSSPNLPLKPLIPRYQALFEAGPIWQNCQCLWCAVLADKETGEGFEEVKGPVVAPPLRPPLLTMCWLWLEAGGGLLAREGGPRREPETLNPTADECYQGWSDSGPLAPRHRSQPLGRRGPPSWQLSVSAPWSNILQGSKFSGGLPFRWPPSFVELREILSPDYFEDRFTCSAISSGSSLSSKGRRKIMGWNEVNPGERRSNSNSKVGKRDSNHLQHRMGLTWSVWPDSSSVCKCVNALNQI